MPIEIDFVFANNGLMKILSILLERHVSMLNQILFLT